MALVQTKVFVSSRRKTALMLLLCSIFIANAILLPGADEPFHWRTLTLAFFGLGVAIFLWLLVRPQRLTLDAEGFTLSGGLVPAAKARKMRWADVEPLFLYRAPGYRGLPGPKAIGINFTPEAPERTRLARFNRDKFGVDGSLPGLWPEGPEKMIQELNDYREYALRLTDKYAN